MIKWAVKVVDNLQRVVKHEEDVRRKTLFKTAAFGRTTMKRSIRKRKGPSAPGQPPHSHVGTLRDLMKFRVDLADGSLVVGPEIFKPRHQPHGAPVPRILDVGGSFRYGRAGRLLTFKARPFVQSAFETTMKQLPRIIAEASK